MDQFQQSGQSPVHRQTHRPRQAIDPAVFARPSTRPRPPVFAAHEPIVPVHQTTMAAATPPAPAVFIPAPARHAQSHAQPQAQHHAQPARPAATPAKAPVPANVAAPMAAAEAPVISIKLTVPDSQTLQDIIAWRPTAKQVIGAIIVLFIFTVGYQMGVHAGAKPKTPQAAFVPRLSRLI